MLADAGIDDFFVLYEDYVGTSANIVHRHAAEVVIRTLNPAERSEVERLYPDVFDWSADSARTFQHEEALEAALSESIESDAVELGSPDKFRAHMDRWAVVGVFRSGRVESELLWPDAALVERALAEGEQYSSLFVATVTPHHPLAWQAARSSVRYCLLGVQAWTELVDAYLAEVEQASPAASVSMRIFSPCDVVWALFGVAAQGHSGYMPSLEILVVPEDGIEPLLVTGGLFWDGRPAPTTLQDTVGAVYEDLGEFLMNQHVGEQWQNEDRLAELHRLRYGALEWRLTDGPAAIPQALSAQDGSVIRTARLNESRRSSAVRRLSGLQLSPTLKDLQDQLGPMVFTSDD